MVTEYLLDSNMITTYFYSHPANTKHLYNIYTTSTQRINVMRMFRACWARSSLDLQYYWTADHFELLLLNIIRLNIF